MASYKVDESSLTAVADAIRERAGTIETLAFPDGFVSKSKSVPYADGEWDAVVFVDYDGTVLHSYTLEEIQAMTELPPLPSHSGLICQEWNWTLADIKALNRAVIVGATYITDDSATRLHIRIPDQTLLTVPLHFNQSVANGVTIDWGDGSATETLGGTGNVNTSHTYEEIGDYTISLLPNDNCKISLGSGTDNNTVFGSCVGNGRSTVAMLQSINIGKNFESSGDYAFKHCRGLKTISIPKTFKFYSVGAFAECRSVKCIVFSKGIGYVGYQPFNNCSSLEIISFPKELKNNINNNSFYYDYSLKSVTLPDTMTTIPSGMFACCECLSYVKIPHGVTSVGAEAFLQCYGLRVVDFTSCTSVPTLSNINAFKSITSNCEIRVPTSLYGQWIAATNWSEYTANIVGV